MVWIRRVKTDLTDPTMSVSWILANTFNMDYDGDALNLSRLPTKEMVREAHNFQVHHNVLGLRGPNMFSSVLSLPKSINDTLGRFFHYRGLGT